MLHIMKLKLVLGLTDAKYIFLAALMVLAFLLNGISYSERYQLEQRDYRASIAENHRMIRQTLHNMQEFSIFEHTVVAPPRELAFIADGGGSKLPNAQVTSAFSTYEKIRLRRDNKAMPTLPAIDWIFIVGFMGSLLAVVSGYSVFAEERQNGTFRQVMANPVSRLSVFFGSYFGVLLTIIISLVIGILLNLAVLAVFGGPQFSTGFFAAVGQAFLFSLAFLSSFVFLSLAVSATTRNPTIALVVLLAFWVLLVVAIPGISQLAVESLTDIRGPAAEETEYEARIEELKSNAGPRYSDWSGDPYADFVVNRADYRSKAMELSKEIADETHNQKVNQLKACLRAAAVSPYGSLRDALLDMSGGSVYGLEELHSVVNTYQKQVLQFIKSEDAAEQSPHLVYGIRRGYDKGVFSDKELSFEAIPKAEVLWSGVRQKSTAGIPWFHWSLLFIFNLLAGLFALALLMRLDPR